MKTGKKLVITLVIVLCIAAVAGITIIAATNAGSQSNPLVTLSYLNNDAKKDFLSSANSELDAQSGALRSELDDKISDFEDKIESQIGSAGGASDTDVFSVVTLSSGQTVVCSVGAEIMLRIGTAQAYGSDSPALVDTTSAVSVEAGESLTKNHMYMVTIAGCGVKATASVTKILIRGDYTIS